jgi:hypothetical protein
MSTTSYRTSKWAIHPSLRGPASVGNLYIRVGFSEALSTEQVVDRINLLPNPQVIVWYIGCRGLREEGMRFYGESLFSPVLQQNTEAVFWLVDLTAWGAFSDSRRSVEEVSRWCKSIEELSNKHIKCIRSAEIFKKMQSLQDGDIAMYFRQALRRAFISEVSKGFPSINIRVKEVFGCCPVMTDLLDCDLSKAYSVLQYFEACLLVDEIIAQRLLIGEREINVAFALPNDEFKYYSDESHAFRKDIEFLVRKRCESLGISEIVLSVNFFSFSYGSHSGCRPYNAPGRTFKSRALTYSKLIYRQRKIARVQRGEHAAV